MGSSSSSSGGCGGGGEGPSLLEYTFLKIQGEHFVYNMNAKDHFTLIQMSLYQVPVDMIAHLAKTSHYFLLFDVQFEDQKGYILTHFTEDGNSTLQFFNSRSEAIFKTFEGKYLTDKIELLRYSQITEKKTVGDLLKVFNEWTLPYNLIVSNCRHYTAFIEEHLLKKIEKIE